MNTALIHSPFVQAIFFLILIPIVIPVLRPSSTEHIYNTAGILFVLFIVVNTVLLFWSPTPWRYFFISVLAAVLFIMVAYQIAVIFIKYIYKIEGSGESSMIFLVIMYHPPALLIAMLIKWIIR
jgi:hypothetical protein